MPTRPLLQARGGALLLAVSLTWTCGGEGSGGDQASSSSDQPEAAQPAANDSQTLSKSDPVDLELAARGEGLFQSKGCVACHTVGNGKLVGPDLLGVTERRELDWMQHMMMNPDSMLQADATAKELLGQFFTPMANMKVTQDEARALINFLRRETEAADHGSS